MTEPKVTLGWLLDGLGLDIVSVLAAPKGLDVEAGVPVIHDALDPRDPDPRSVVLAVGVRPGNREAVDLVERAGRAGCAAVVFRVDGDGYEPLVKVAESVGVALLGVPGQMEWGQVHALLRSAAAVGAVREDTPVPIGDLFALANAVASSVGGATTIEDRQSNLLAYSSGEHPIDEPRRQTILGRRVSEEWVERLRNDGVFTRLYASEGVVRIEYDASEMAATRLAVAVRAGDEVLGSIWVAEGDRPLGEESEAALREAGRLAALHLLRHRSSDALERRHRSELLRGALEGRVSPVALAAPLSLGPAEPVAVLGFELVDAGEGADLEARIERVVDLIAFTTEAHRRSATCAAIGRRIYALIPGDGEVRAMASAIAERSEASLRIELRIGIGSVVDGLAHVVRSRAEADAVLRVLAEVGGSVAGVADVHPRVVLHRLRDLAVAEADLLAGKVELLARSDRERGTEYIATLRAFLDAFGDVRAAAARIYVHPNTFRYRLRRLVETAGLDLEDPIERLIAHLQLHLRESGTP